MSRRTQLRRGLTLLPFILAALLATGSLAGDIETDGPRRGAITGKVLEGRTGDPIPLVEIQIWNEAGEYLEAALSDMTGAYTVGDLSPGRYYAGTIESGFLDELFRDRPCPLGECDPTAGTPIEVSGGVTTANVNFVLHR